MNRIIASVGDRKGTLTFQLCEYQGTRTLDIRKYYYDKQRAGFFPTRKGISVAERTFTIVMNVLRTHENDIKEWLEGISSLSQQVKEDQKQQAEAAERARYAPRDHLRQRDSWKSPEFFGVRAEGGKDTITYNQSHPFASIFEDIGDRLLRADNLEERQECVESIKDLVSVILISFVRARRLFEDAPVISPDTLFDTLSFNWGTILQNYLDNGGGAKK